MQSGNGGSESSTRDAAREDNTQRKPLNRTGGNVDVCSSVHLPSHGVSYSQKCLEVLYRKPGPDPGRTRRE